MTKELENKGQTKHPFKFEFHHCYQITLGYLTWSSFNIPPKATVSQPSLGVIGNIGFLSSRNKGVPSLHWGRVHPDSGSSPVVITRDIRDGFPRLSQTSAFRPRWKQPPVCDKILKYLLSCYYYVSSNNLLPNIYKEVIFLFNFFEIGLALSSLLLLREHK